MRIERHVFGSRTGYTTLAQGGGLDQSDLRVLESFVFGQTTDQRYLESLSRMPAYISRALGSNRRAITRVFPGSPDDRGRATLLFITAVISGSDWINVLKGDVAPILKLQQVWQWDGQRTISGLNLPITGPDRLGLEGEQAKEVLGILSELERCDASGRNVVLDAPQHSFATVRAIDMLIPDEVKPRFSSAARSLSANVDVRLNCVARGANVRSTGPEAVTYRPKNDGRYSPYASALMTRGLLRGLIPWDLIKSHKGFGLTFAGEAEGQFDVVEGALGAPAATQRRKGVWREMGTRTRVILGVSVFAVVAAAVLGFGLYRKRGAWAAQQGLIKKAEAIVKISPEEFVLNSQEEMKDRLTEARKVKSLVDDNPNVPQGLANELGRWLLRFASVQGECGRRKEALEKLKASLSYAPQFPDEQLPPQTVEGLKAAVRKAKGIKDELVVEVDAKQVDLSPAFGQDIHELNLRADEVGNDLARREKAYACFVAEIERTLKSNQDAKAKDLIAQLDKEWFRWAEPDAAKKERLKVLYNELNTREQRPKKEADLREQLKGIIAALRQPKPETMGDVLAQCEDALPKARLYDNLKALAEEAQRAGATARETQALKAPPPKEKVTEEEKRKVTREVFDQAQKVLHAKAEERQALVGQVDAGLKHLESLDAAFGKRLSKAIEDVMHKPLEPPKPVVKNVRVKPDWGIITAESEQSLLNAKGWLEQLQGEPQKEIKRLQADWDKVQADWDKKDKQFKENESNRKQHERVKEQHERAMQEKKSALNEYADSIAKIAEYQKTLKGIKEQWK